MTPSNPDGIYDREHLDRQDLRAAISLLERARSLTPNGSPAHRRLALDICIGLFRSGEYDRAGIVLGELGAEAAEAQDNLTLAHVTVGLAFLSRRGSPEGPAANARAEADAAPPIFQTAGDRLEMARALLPSAEEGRITSTLAPYLQFYEHALEHLRSASDRYWVVWALGEIAELPAVGPAPVPDAIARIQEILRDDEVTPGLRGRVQACLGLLLALQGRVREALGAETQGEAILRELGNEVDLARAALFAGPSLRFLGQLDRAERLLRDADGILERSAELSMRSTVLAELAQVLIEQRRPDDAERTALQAIEISPSGDHVTFVLAHGTLSRVLANRGDPSAEAEARLAVVLAEPTDMLWQQGEEWEHLAEALLAQGRQEEATDAFRTGLGRFEQKGATVLADRVRARLHQLTIESSPSDPYLQSRSLCR